MSDRHLHPDHDDDLETAMIAVRAFAMVLGEIMDPKDTYTVTIDGLDYKVMIADEKITLIQLGEHDPRTGSQTTH